MTAFANLDHDRLARQGFPEVVFADGKTPEQVAAIMAEFAGRAGHALARNGQARHHCLSVLGRRYAAHIRSPQLPLTRHQRELDRADDAGSLLERIAGRDPYLQ